MESGGPLCTTGRASSPYHFIIPFVKSKKQKPPSALKGEERSGATQAERRAWSFTDPSRRRPWYQPRESRRGFGHSL